MTDPNALVSDMTIREMFALEIAANLHGNPSVQLSDGEIRERSITQAEALIEDLNNRGK